MTYGKVICSILMPSGKPFGNASLFFGFYHDFTAVCLQGASAEHLIEDEGMSETSFPI